MIRHSYGSSQSLMIHALCYFADMLMSHDQLFAKELIPCLTALWTLNIATAFCLTQCRMKVRQVAASCHRPCLKDSLKALGVRG